MAMETALTADPLGVSASIVVAVERQPVAVQAQGVALIVIPPLQQAEGVLILGVTAGDDDAQGIQVVVDVAQDLVEPLPGVADHLSDGEVGEAVEQVFETGDGLQVVVAVGGDEGTGDRPVGEQSIVHDVEALGLVAEMILTP